MKYTPDSGDNAMSYRRKGSTVDHLRTKTDSQTRPGPAKNLKTRTGPKTSENLGPSRTRNSEKPETSDQTSTKISSRRQANIFRASPQIHSGWHLSIRPIFQPRTEPWHTISEIVGLNRASNLTRTSKKWNSDRTKKKMNFLDRSPGPWCDIIYVRKFYRTILQYFHWKISLRTP